MKRTTSNLKLKTKTLVSNVPKLVNAPQRYGYVCAILHNFEKAILGHFLRQIGAPLKGHLQNYAEAMCQQKVRFWASFQQNSYILHFHLPILDPYAKSKIEIRVMGEEKLLKAQLPPPFVKCKM